MSTRIKPKYVLLEGIAYGNKFFCLTPEDDPTRLYNGELAYNILGYADTIAEAQTKLFGYSSTTSKD